LEDYVFEYMKIYDPSFARTMAESSVVHSPAALREAIDVAQTVGCDEFFLVPTTADPHELDRTREPRLMRIHPSASASAVVLR